jgi:hypothetical protein
VIRASGRFSSVLQGLAVNDVLYERVAANHVNSQKNNGSNGFLRRHFLRRATDLDDPNSNAEHIVRAFNQVGRSSNIVRPHFSNLLNVTRDIFF